MDVLLVEDDRSLGAGIRDALTARGFSVEWISDGATALDFAGECGCVVLDWRLPGASGLEVLRAWRERGFSAPVLMLTARDAVRDRVTGLNAGADDYLVKPFAAEELAARVRAMLRRGRGENRMQAAGLCLDPDAFKVFQDGREIPVSVREFDLLADLVRNAGRVRARERLEAAIYGWRDPPEGNTLEVCVHGLRAKLGPNVIRTVRGVGYMVERK